jgi:type II secretory pathway component HofQ
MYRVLVPACVVVLCLGLLTRAAPAPQPATPITQKLARRLSFTGFDDPKTTLAEALDQLTNISDIPFTANERAFQGENVQDVLKTEIVTTSPIPAMKNVRLDTILHRVLARVPSESGAAYTVRGDHIEITTQAAQAAEIWGEYTGPHLPLIHAVFQKTPLDEALTELAEQTDFNIVLDNRATDKAKTAVTARLLNTPLDTALRLLADMTDLRAVHLDNVLYVTTKENAAAWEARLEKEKTPTNPLDDSGDAGTYKPRKGSGPGTVPVKKPGAA